ncbi:Pr2TM family membrane protein [Flavobacterium sp. SE-s28]|uniref:Pr2TM family membrane protein n=2 Tax=Flavobacterium silvaticum TaxID=1852020 RepID=A0A972FTW4_9FLAO|nr:Pr2TM family membrane protein [Flavobacterium silvaticum]
MKLSFRVVPRLLLLSVGIFCILLTYNYVFGYRDYTAARLGAIFLYTTLYTFALYFANAWYFCLLDKKFEGNRFSVKRVGLGFAGSFLISLTVIFGLRFFEDVVLKGIDVNQFITEESAGNYMFATVMTFIITLSLYSVGFYRAYQENRVNEQKIIAGTASARFESLKNQIDPHFLFNSLNVLTSLIEENPEQARKFTISLSKVYRYVLEQKDKDLVPLSEELSFANSYIQLLQMRFESGLVFELGSGMEDENLKIVPLSLQLLLENTIKHNVVNSDKPLSIRIFQEGGMLVVQNGLQPKQSLNESAGVGLRNIIDRYALLTKKRVVIDNSNGYFTVKLPLLTHRVHMETIIENNQSERYLMAQKRVEDLKSFYGNLGSYLVMNTGLAVLNFMTSPQYLWFFWPLAGWGLGVLFHAIKVFNLVPFMGRDWEERKIRKIMNQQKNQNWN